MHDGTRVHSAVGLIGRIAESAPRRERLAARVLARALYGFEPL